MPVAPELVPLPEQPTDVPWPMPTWPHADPDPRLDSKALASLFDEAFGGPSDLGETRALLAIQGGAIVAERYGPGLDADSTHRSWSMAKSWMQAAVGVLVGDGRLELDAPAPVSAWTEPDDPRRRITLRQLLEMRSGLHFIEDYVEEAGTASVVDMLFGSGRSDVAAYAAKSPLAHEPGTFYYYSSGTTNIVARLVQDTLGLDGDAFGDFLRGRLFEPIGATTPKPEFDARGTWIASSFLPATARTSRGSASCTSATGAGKTGASCRTAGSTRPGANPVGTRKATSTDRTSGSCPTALARSNARDTRDSAPPWYRHSI